jgi:hypothetical protein
MGGMVAGATNTALNGAGWQGILMGAGIGGILGGGLGGLALAGHGFAAAMIAGVVAVGGAVNSYQQNGWESVGDFAGGVIGGIGGGYVGYQVGTGLGNALKAPSPQQQQAKVQSDLKIDQKPSPKLKTNYDIEGKAKSFDLVYDNESVSYPLNRGFQGPPERMTLQLGTLVDRYGPPSGRFVSPQGVSAAARSLPPGVANAQLNTYQVLKPFDVYGGPTAPAFNQPGGGTQYFLDRTVHDLIKQGYLGEVD